MKRLEIYIFLIKVLLWDYKDKNRNVFYNFSVFILICLTCPITGWLKIGGIDKIIKLKIEMKMMEKEKELFELEKEFFDEELKSTIERTKKRYKI